MDAESIFGGFESRGAGGAFRGREVDPEDMDDNDKVFCSTRLSELVAELKADPTVSHEHLDRLVESVGYDAPIFYDLLQENGTRLYPRDTQYSTDLERVLHELSLRVSREALARAVETIKQRETIACVGNKPTYVDLARDSPRWKSVADKCGEHLEVTRVQAVYNEYLEEQYSSFKLRMSKKPFFVDVNERILFHGTGRTSPDLVCLGSEGFDPRCSRHGNYGCGSYFSTTPNYSAKNYAYIPKQPHMSCEEVSTLFESAEAARMIPRQIVMARVALGNIYDMKNTINQRLTRPPPLPIEPIGHVLHDSVMGGPFSSRSTEMHMVVVYDKAQALPEYLVTVRYRSTFEEANKPSLGARRAMLAAAHQAQYRQIRPKSTPSAPTSPPPCAFAIPPGYMNSLAYHHQSRPRSLPTRFSAFPSLLNDSVHFAANGNPYFSLSSQSAATSSVQASHALLGAGASEFGGPATRLPRPGTFNKRRASSGESHLLHESASTGVSALDALLSGPLLQTPKSSPVASPFAWPSPTSSMASFFVKPKRTRAPSGIGEEDEHHLAQVDRLGEDPHHELRLRHEASTHHYHHQHQADDYGRVDLNNDEASEKFLASLERGDRPLRADKKRMISRAKSEHITRTPLRLASPSAIQYSLPMAESPPLPASTSSYEEPRFL
ncbi:Poly ADP-ribose polymerase 12 [Hondaea fermentalgiana]|uniref:Poly ADP-ribose polymerase 12 n=1 Tax=Hondaea fermentalgiana TaxID=2315210 RepID=A0A2R5G9T8_9STRA|nr:Poly ADP-ribose polymerase 12 [Hondaea fermentalgiana]|eukprot:GBG26498.1 Poly ADP-ribose polymerase 12 [Hondaea fermentalgiana]